MLRAAKNGKTVMTDVERLLKLFRAYAEKDDSAFFRAAESLIADELAANHHSLATELQKALDAGRPRRSSRASRNGLSSLPKDRRTGDALVSIVEKPLGSTELILAEEAKGQIERILDEHRQRLRLVRSGYTPKTKILFWGPPGCGKTLTAHFLAHEFGIPLGVVRLSAVISSYLGDTASHIQRAFDLASRTPMVLLLDEVDAIGKNRDDPNDVGELKRVVNSLLQAMDGFSSTESVVIAASNHQYLLDPAIWRRFDDIVYFPMPSASERKTQIQRLLNGIEAKASIDTVVKKTAGLSFASIERIVTESIKTTILEDRDELRSADISKQIKIFKESTDAAQQKITD